MGRRLRHGPARERHRNVLHRPHLRAPESDVGLRSLRRGNVYPTVRLPGRRLRRRALLLGVWWRMRARMLSRARVRLPELRHAGDLPGGARLALYVRLPVQPRLLRSVNHDVSAEGMTKQSDPAGSGVRRPPPALANLWHNPRRVSAIPLLPFRRRSPSCSARSSRAAAVSRSTLFGGPLPRERAGGTRRRPRASEQRSHHATVDRRPVSGAPTLGAARRP
jgi:hypothetical protein